MDVPITKQRRLCRAAYAGNSKQVRTILRRAAASEEEAMKRLVQKQRMSRTRSSTRRERRKQATAFINIVRVNDLEPQSGCSPLHWAVRNSKCALVCRLCDSYGAIVDLPSRKDEKTPLHFAAEARRDRKRLVRALLDRGAGVNIQDALGRTPIFLACLHGYEDACLELLAQGADPNLRNNRSETPYMVARRARFSKVVRILERSPVLAGHMLYR